MSTLLASPNINTQKSTNIPREFVDDIVTSLPADVFQKSTMKAFKALLLSITLCAIGYTLIALLPWYFLPILWVFLGACYAGIHSVSHDCGRGSFSRSPLLNNIVGNIVSLPLLLPYESWKIQTNSKLMDVTYQSMATRRWTWWLSSTIAWIRANFVLSTVFKPGNRRRVIFSLACLYIFVSVFFPVMLNYVGFWGLCKFYLIPWILYQFWMSTFISLAYRIPFMEDTKLRVSIAFPSASKLPQWLNFLTNDINYVLSMTRYFSDSLENIVSSIPNHNVRRSFVFIKQGLSQKMESLGHMTEVKEVAKEKFRGVNWIPATWIVGTPILTIYAMFTTPLYWNTFLLAVVGYLAAGLGITVGYHRLFAHRSFETGPITKFFILMCGTSAFQGSCQWWARDHRAHHRYVDTEQDPYNISKGFFWAHVGWLLVKQDKAKVGKADTVDLEKDPMLLWQDKYYLPLAFLTGILLPTCVAGLGWGDWRGGFFYACVARSVLVLQSTFCVNSLAHYVGSHTFTDEHSPRDSWLVSLVTFGEGYHNFHHEFPYDYRNGVKPYAYDPSKWTIWFLSKLGLTHNLKRFPANEIKKGELQMMQKRLDKEKTTVDWGKKPEELPVYTLEEVSSRVKEGASLIVVNNYVHDIAKFIPDHPGGIALIKAYLGKDATKVFHGGVYSHSNGARNLLSILRVGRIISTEEDKKSV